MTRHNLPLMGWIAEDKQESKRCITSRSMWLEVSLSTRLIEVGVWRSNSWWQPSLGRSKCLSWRVDCPDARGGWGGDSMTTSELILLLCCMSLPFLIGTVDVDMIDACLVRFRRRRQTLKNANRGAWWYDSGPELPLYCHKIVHRVKLSPRDEQRRDQVSPIQGIHVRR